MQGVIVISGGKDNAIRLWNLTDCNLNRVIGVHSQEVRSLAIWDNVVVSGGYDRKVKLWDLFNQYNNRVLLTSANYILSVAISENYVVCGEGNGVVETKFIHFGWLGNIV